MTGQVDSDRPTPLGSQRLRPARLDPVDLGTTGESMDEQHRTLAREAVDGEPELRRHRFSDSAATNALAAEARAWVAVHRYTTAFNPDRSRTVVQLEPI
jgi:hypothetical protein